MIEQANSDTDPVDETIEQTERGVTLKLEHKRGTGTRDEDKVKCEIRGRTFSDVMQRRTEAIDAIVNTMGTLRADQPDSDTNNG